MKETFIKYTAEFAKYALIWFSTLWIFGFFGISIDKEVWDWAIVFGMIFIWLGFLLGRTDKN